MVEVTDYERDRQGKIRRLGLLVTDEDGREREYMISGRAVDVEKILRAVGDTQAIDAPRYGLRSVFAHETERRAAA